MSHFSVISQCGPHYPFSYIINYSFYLKKNLLRLISRIITNQEAAIVSFCYISHSAHSFIQKIFNEFHYVLGLWDVVGIRSLLWLFGAYHLMESGKVLLNSSCKKYEYHDLINPGILKILKKWLWYGTKDGLSYDFYFYKLVNVVFL